MSAKLAPKLAQQLKVRGRSLLRSMCGALVRWPLGDLGAGCARGWISKKACLNPPLFESYMPRADITASLHCNEHVLQKQR